MEDRFLEVFRELVGIRRVARLRYSLDRSERIGQLPNWVIRGRVLSWLICRLFVCSLLDGADGLVGCNHIVVGSDVMFVWRGLQ